MDKAIYFLNLIFKKKFKTKRKLYDAITFFFALESFYL